MTTGDNITGTLGEYYRQKIVTAIVGVEADINSVDRIIKEIAGYTNVDDEYVVTGEYDIILKVRFPDYSGLQKFLVDDLGKIAGIKRTKTMMALSVVKESGKKIME
ncbi:MAG: Lrp/AsnC ligand binding domain-containing protein [Candidatus Thermoplasmatota archaeon]|jgi:DNA-binding Lrp family transcriptional regulator|nr:Lrp/AsnC ligand binding domain-containing protein [Candidatus Thermoplasmatota archaeon]MCL5678807.1 Lrp/AsnC ligand binding domain-containing protein [Candidatus Thermoplasmatota archaeon]